MHPCAHPVGPRFPHLKGTPLNISRNCRNKSSPGGPFFTLLGCDPSRAVTCLPSGAAKHWSSSLATGSEPLDGSQVLLLPDNMYLAILAVMSTICCNLFSSPTTSDATNTHLHIGKTVQNVCTVVGGYVQASHGSTQQQNPRRIPEVSVPRSFFLARESLLVKQPNIVPVGTHPLEFLPRGRFLKVFLSLSLFQRYLKTILCMKASLR